MFYKGELRPWEHEGKTPDREAAQSLERMASSKTILVNQVTRRKKELDEAVQAKAVLDSMKNEEQQAPFCVISVAQNFVAEKTNTEKAILNELRSLENAELEASAADKKTAEAKTHHEKSLLWSKLAVELSPSGIQLSITGKAVEAFNRQLRSYDGMPLVQIDVSGSITLNNRSYYLLSVSEKWRVNTLLALAYAEITGVKLVILDCFDVLDMPSRMPFMKLFKTLIDQERIDSIIAIATLKQIPKLPEAFTCYWVEKGMVLTDQKETEAA
jgi:hypothetical protein